MIRINLLPHRAEKRKRRQVQFISLCVVSAILGGALVGVGYGFMSVRILYQEQRNDYLKKEIAKLEKQIQELEQLRAEIKQLLARKDEVEKLQSARSDVVHLLDQMLHIMPPGVYLKSLKQESPKAGSAATESKINIVGIAQTEARVSTLMRAVDASRWLDTPTLIDVHSVPAGKDRVHEFAMTFNLKKGVELTPAASAPVAASAPAAALAPAGASAPAVASAPAAPAVPAAPGKKE